jgi:hypothetical protein
MKLFDNSIFCPQKERKSYAVMEFQRLKRLHAGGND